MPPLITGLAVESGKRRKDKERSEDEQLRADCFAKGGAWNSATRSCRLPEPEKKEPEFAKGGTGTEPETEEEFRARAEAGQARDPRGVEVVRDEETGELSGITKEGKTFFLPPKEVRSQAEAIAERQELVLGGTAEAGQARAAERQARAGSELATRVGEGSLPSFLEEFSAGQRDYAAGFMSAVPGLIPDLITGGTAGFVASRIPAVGMAATGVGVPAAVATTVGMVITGAILKATQGFYRDTIGHLGQQQRGIIETPIRTLTETKGVFQTIISSQNANPGNAIENFEAFQNQIAIVDNAFSDLKLYSKDSATKFLGEDTIDQLHEFEVFYSLDGERAGFMEDFRLALANPDPSLVKVSTSEIEELRKRLNDEMANLR